LACSLERPSHFSFIFSPLQAVHPNTQDGFEFFLIFQILLIPKPFKKGAEIDTAFKAI